MAGEKTQRVAAVHGQRLLFGHARQILHHKPVLGPVLECGSVATVYYEFMGMLGHALVEVVLYHSHHGCSLGAFCRIFIDRTGVDAVGGAVAVHIDAAVLLELCGELRGKLGVQLGREIAQCVAKRQFLFGGGQYVFAFGSVIY